jgi:hypothetical protein
MHNENPLRDSGAEGRRRKEAAVSDLEIRRSAFIRHARREFLHILLAHDLATSDDLRERLKLPEGVNPKLFGAVPGALAKAGIITQDGFARTTRPQAHGRPVAIWRLVNRQLAQEWLATHRDWMIWPAEHHQRILFPFDRSANNQRPRG